MLILARVSESVFTCTVIIHKPFLGMDRYYWSILVGSEPYDTLDKGEIVCKPFFRYETNRSFRGEKIITNLLQKRILFTDDVVVLTIFF